VKSKIEGPTSEESFLLLAVSSYGSRRQGREREREREREIEGEREREECIQPFSGNHTHNNKPTLK
jgi:hypothetical protein